jgi:hypothetical protein
MLGSDKVIKVVIFCLIGAIFLISPAVAMAADTVVLNGYEIHLQDVSYDTACDCSTWTYRVTGTGASHALSNWVLGLGLGDCLEASDILGADPDDYEVGEDPKSGVTGIKWEVGVEPYEQRTFTVQLKGLYEVGLVDVSVKAGNEIETGQIDGPSCTPFTGIDISVDQVWTDDGQGPECPNMWARFTPEEPLTVNTIFTIGGDPAVKYRVVLILFFIDSTGQKFFITRDVYLEYPGTHYVSTDITIPPEASLGRSRVAAKAIVFDNGNSWFSAKHAVIYID